jgi:hypothetical protein
VGVDFTGVGAIVAAYGVLVAEGKTEGVTVKVTASPCGVAAGNRSMLPAHATSQSSNDMLKRGSTDFIDVIMS